MVKRKRKERQGSGREMTKNKDSRIRGNDSNMIKRKNRGGEISEIKTNGRE